MESPLRLHTSMPPPSFATIVAGSNEQQQAFPAVRNGTVHSASTRRASGVCADWPQHARSSTGLMASAEQQHQSHRPSSLTQASGASDAAAVPAASTPGSGKPPRQISPPLRVSPPPAIQPLSMIPSPSSATAAHTGAATPPAAAARVSLPPLPPLGERFGSPAFVPQNPSSAASQPNHRSYSNTNLYSSSTAAVPPSPAHSPMHVWAGSSAASMHQPKPLQQQQQQTPLFAPAAQSSPSHNFAPRPSSPHALGSFSLAGSTPALQLLNGTVCVCPNDPQAAPCNCSVGVGVGVGVVSGVGGGGQAQTPLLTGSRPLSQSTSMDGGFLLSRASSHGTAVGNGGQPSVAMPTCWSPHLPGPQRRHTRQGSVSSLATTLSLSNSLSNSSHSNSSTPSYTSLASLGMVSPSSLPTQAAPLSGSHAHSSSGNGGGGGGVTINIFNNPQTQQQVQMHSSAMQLMQAQTAGLAGTSPIPPAQRLSHNQHSIFSPSAPGTLETLQRQLSVSPQEFAPTPTASPPPSANAQAQGIGSAVSSALAPSAPHTTIRIVAPAGSETQHTAVSNMPLTASTIRLIKKAVEAVRSLFPSSGDSAVELQTKDASSSAVETTVVVARERTVSPRSSQPPSPKILRAAPATPVASAVTPASPAAANAAAPAAASSCSCPTAPVVCYCAHNLHRVSSAPEFVIDSLAIGHGYRGILSPWDCVRGLGQVHNETANVWSHVWASGFMAVQAWRVGSVHPELRMQALAGSGLFSLSALAHLFAPVSAELNASLFRLDRCAISADETAIGICGALIHFSGGEHTRLRRLVVGLNLALGALSLRALWNPEALQNKSIKIGVLSAQALVCFFPAWLARRASLQSDPELHALLGRYAALAGGWAGLGVLLYGSGFPEKMIYRAEEQENLRRHDESAAAAAALASASSASASSSGSASVESVTPVCRSCSPSPVSSTASSCVSSAASACSSDAASGCCSRPAPSLPLHLIASRPWRWLHWLTSHVLHSHHLMHWCVWLAVWFAFKGSWMWKLSKLRAAAAAAATNAMN